MRDERAGSDPDSASERSEDDTLQTTLTRVKARCRRVSEQIKLAQSMRPPTPGGVDQVDVARLQQIKEPKHQNEDHGDPLSRIIDRIMGSST